MQAEQDAYSVWQTRVQVANENNANPSTTYWAGLNCLSDTPLPPLFPQKLSARQLLKTPIPKSQVKKTLGLKLPANPAFNSKLRNSGFMAADCPSSMDWRALGAVSDVKDQGQVRHPCVLPVMTCNALYL